MFAPLPTTMSKLEAAVQLMDDPGLQPPPPDMLDIGERLRKVYAKARSAGYADLTRSELRKLPYAYWSNSAPVLTQVESDLVRQYWEIHLPEALKSNPRRAKRWLAPLFFIYCERFSQSNLEFLDFARRFVSAIQLTDGLFAQKLQVLQKELRFFTPSEAPNSLADHLFLNWSKPLDGLLQDLQLWPGFLASDFGSAVFRAGLGLPAANLRDAQTVLRLMDWSKRMPASLVKTGFRVLYANALLSCWVGHKPADYLKNILIDYFLKQYGDPRFQAHLHYQWDGVSQQSKGVILNWLTGDTLRGFMKLLQRTADDIWQYRQKFWMAYYERGYIDEAWMALGDHAWWAAQSLKTDQKGMGCARLDGGAANNQSVLLLKIGGLVFTEWSHNGSLRAYLDGSPEAPNLYQSSYHGADLRAATSLDFHDGLNMNPELRHMNAEGGTWQRKARDFIRRQTNVHLSDSEIL
jgi:hypothetical protein